MRDDETLDEDRTDRDEERHAPNTAPEDQTVELTEDDVQPLDQVIGPDSAGHQGTEPSLD